MRRILLGTTYSSIQAKNLELPPQAFDELLDLKFDLIRIGTYWNSIETNKGKCDFSEIKKLLDLCEKRDQKVVLTVGMKGPRWPEFYLPKWLDGSHGDIVQESLLKYLKMLVNELKGYSSIQYWQVENEPLDPSGLENKSIPLSFLKKEIQEIREVDNRPIISTLWGNELSKRGLINMIAEEVNIIGIDLYYKQFIKKLHSISIYGAPLDSDNTLKVLFKNMKKPLWIMELQAEPWEHSSAEYKSEKPKSMNAKLLKQSYNRALKLQTQAIFLWGYEYWYFKKLQGDSDMWNAVKELQNSK